jgi:hypothetical protein
MPKRDWRYKDSSPIRRYQLSKETRACNAIYDSGKHTFSTIGMSPPTIDSAVARLAALIPKRRWTHKASIPHANINANRSEIATQHNTVGCGFAARLAALMSERGRRYENLHPSLKYQSKERHARLQRD